MNNLVPLRVVIVVVCALLALNVVLLVYRGRDNHLILSDPVVILQPETEPRNEVISNSPSRIQAIGLVVDSNGNVKTSDPPSVSNAKSRSDMQMTREEAVAKQSLEAMGSWVRKEQGFHCSDHRFMNCVDAVRGHIDVCLDFYRGAEETGYVRSGIIHVINQAIGPTDGDVVISRVIEFPWLVQSIVKNGWSRRAREQLLTIVRENTAAYRDSIWTHQASLHIGMALADGAVQNDYPLLTSVVLSTVRAEDQLNLLQRFRELPGYPWRDALLKAHGYHPPDKAGPGLTRLAIAAAEEGGLQAVADLIDHAQGSPKNALPELSRGWFEKQRFTGYKVPTSNWFLSQRHKLQWKSGAGWTIAEGVPEAPVQLSVAVDDGVPDAPDLPWPADLPIDAGVIEYIQWLKRIEERLLASDKSISAFNVGKDALVATPRRFVLEMAKYHMGAPHYHMQNIILESLLVCARREHQRELIDWCDTEPKFIQIILEKRWHQRAAAKMRVLLNSAVAGRSSKVRTDIVGVLSRVGDPVDVSSLRKILVWSTNGFDQLMMSKHLIRMHGFDMSEAVHAAWGRYPSNEYVDRQQGFAPIAARYGIAEALPVVVAWANREPMAVKINLWQPREAANAMLLDAFGFDVEKNDVAAWWMRVRDSVRWDPIHNNWVLPRVSE